MLNLPIPLEHPMAREIGIGLIYGTAMAATLAAPRRLTSMTWCLIVIAVGYFTFSQSLAWGMPALVAPSTLCYTWVLAGLVFLCRIYENIRIRAADFHGQSRQFSLWDLFVLTTAVAFFAAALRQTPLAERTTIYWAGMIIIGGVLPWCVINFRIDAARSIAGCLISLAAATALVCSLSWAESSLAQPNRIPMQEAVWRYGAMIAAIMLPRLLHQLTRIPFSWSHRHVPNAAR
ncbi:hypothetical protein [Rhodopirellula sallentina]|uniref:Membrane protein n=1 Tax=Rhodopirellula sallentina SM41 TaxID=1263870 RepID=M5UHA0_9BACT|nr:hypothetical protein [Rhodopirellula sallentina]EMI57201.1 membrane protein [Rhodopirellula sallentina SM41]